MEIKEITDKKIWEDFVLRQTPNVFLQSWAWGDLHQQLGETSFRLGIYEGDELLGTALVAKISARRGVFLICEGGPLLAWSRPDLFDFLIARLKRLAKEENASFIRIRPSILDGDSHRDIFRKQGFIKAPRHLHAERTWVLPLNTDEETLLSQMRKGTRYGLNRARRDGVKIQKSIQPEMIKELYRLQNETVGRHHFSPFSLAYLTKEFQSFLPDNQASLFTAEFQSEVVSAAFIIFYGDTAVYHYGGSSEKSSKAFASYLLLWEAIREAKRRGCRYFNFWGVSPADKLSHPWAGLSFFKRGFGGGEVNYLPAQDLPIRPERYWPTYILETAERVYRRL